MGLGLVVGLGLVHGFGQELDLSTSVQQVLHTGAAAVEAEGQLDDEEGRYEDDHEDLAYMFVSRCGHERDVHVHRLGSERDVHAHVPWAYHAQRAHLDGLARATYCPLGTTSYAPC